MKPSTIVTTGGVLFSISLFILIADGAPLVPVLLIAVPINVLLGCIAVRLRRTAR